MGDTAQIVAWTAAICTGVGGLAGGLATAWVMIRKAKAEIKMGERKQEDVVAAEAYALFKDAMNQRINALEEANRNITAKLDKSQEAHKNCEVSLAELKGEMRVMQKDMEALKRHEKVQVKNVEVINEKIKQLDPNADLPPPPIEPIK